MKEKPIVQYSLFDDCVESIENVYNDLGYVLGWRFLNVSKEVFNSPVKIALVTINPAGDKIPLDHPFWASCEDGVSFVVERWDGALPGRSTLQIQVQEMFKLLCTAIQYKGTYIELMSQSLISHFIPFRSPRFDKLPKQEESIVFGRSLWKKIFSVVSPQLVICLGRDVQKQMKSLIQSELSGVPIKSEAFPTGWGKYNAELNTFKKSDGEVRLLYLPHLSTWTLFTSEKTVQNMPKIIKAAARGL
ncbi:MAG: hypothetical protein PVG39_25365 [Desulfobacteraceae bacterium]|jgi:hypothetical protein